MAVPPIPPPIESLGHRPFSFYPPILNAGPNEWHFRRATWSEVLVVNCKTNDEIWLPRTFLGEISRIDEPVVIVGLTKELEYVAGQVLPHVRRIIEMPRAVNDVPRPKVAAPPPSDARVVGIKLENSAESRMGRLVAGAVAAVLIVGVLATFVTITFFRASRDGSRILYRPVMQASLGLSAADDYYAVVRKLGTPSEEHWRAGNGEIKYQLLSYPDRGLFVVLMGAERENAKYVGAFDRSWQVVDSVDLPGGRNTNSMLRSLKRF